MNLESLNPIPLLGETLDFDECTVPTVRGSPGLNCLDDNIVTVKISLKPRKPSPDKQQSSSPHGPGEHAAQVEEEETIAIEEVRAAMPLSLTDFQDPYSTPVIGSGRRERRSPTPNANEFPMFPECPSMIPERPTIQERPLFGMAPNSNNAMLSAGNNNNGEAPFSRAPVLKLRQRARPRFRSARELAAFPSMGEFDLPRVTPQSMSN